MHCRCVDPRLFDKVSFRRRALLYVHTASGEGESGGRRDVSHHGNGSTGSSSLFRRAMRLRSDRAEDYVPDGTERRRGTRTCSKTATSVRSRRMCHIWLWPTATLSLPHPTPTQPQPARRYISCDLVPCFALLPRWPYLRPRASCLPPSRPPRGPGEIVRPPRPWSCGRCRCGGAAGG